MRRAAKKLMAFDSTSFISYREKPLVFYIFSNSETIQELLLSKTTSGGACVNDTMVHMSGTASTEVAASARPPT